MVKSIYVLVFKEEEIAKRISVVANLMQNRDANARGQITLNRNVWSAKQQWQDETPDDQSASELNRAVLLRERRRRN